MNTAVRFSNRFTMRDEPEVLALASKVARARGQKPSEYGRQALRQALQRDGVDPTRNSAANTNANPGAP